MGGILSFAPLDLIDLLLDLQRLEVIELWFVRLKLGVELVLASLFLPREATWTVSISQSRLGKPDYAEDARRTISLRSNKTTRPPLSPVAR